MYILTAFINIEGIVIVVYSKRELTAVWQEHNFLWQGKIFVVVLLFGERVNGSIMIIWWID